MTRVFKLFAAVTLAISLTTPVPAEEEDISLLFVQTSHTMQADLDQHTLQIIDVSDQTLDFSDRPYRVSAHIPLSKFVDGWDKGDDSFAENPPNAVLSVYEGESDENTLVVVTLLSPTTDGGDLIYSYEIVEGKMPASGDVTALFIDRFGPGGGAGAGFHGVGVGARAGFHGVGVGARGPGVAGWAGAAVVNERESDNSC